MLNFSESIPSGSVNEYQLWLGSSKAGICDTAWHSPCTWAPLRWQCLYLGRYTVFDLYLFYQVHPRLFYGNMLYTSTYLLVHRIMAIERVCCGIWCCHVLVLRPSDHTSKQPGQQRRPQNSELMSPRDDVHCVDTGLTQRLTQRAAESVTMATSSQQQCARTSSSTTVNSSHLQPMVCSLVSQWQ